ncbi:hypothetical protein QJQ45_022850, partial [Haematococcus lacustris]
MQLLTSLAALIAGTLSAWLWKARLDGRQCIGAAPLRRSASGVQKAQRKAFHKEMAEAEYLPLIPKDELRQVSGLIADITTARGWAAPSERCWAMWRRLHTIAQSPEGGSWQCSFSEQDLATAKLELLGNVIDNLFLNGALKGHQQTAGAPASQPSINFKVVTETPGPPDWLAHYSPSANAVVLLRHKWSHETMPFDPAQALGMECESFICTCKLQVLLHTIAHEMVHALVMIYFPAIDAHSKAYLPAERHGPIFKLLNKSLFGHLSDSFKHTISAAAPEPPGLQHNPDSKAARPQASKTTKPVPAPAAKAPAASSRSANTSTGTNKGQNSLRRPSSAAAATQPHATTPHPPASTAVRKVAGVAPGASATTPTSWPLAAQEPSTAAANRAAAAAAVKRGARPGARNARQPGPELLVTGAAVAAAVPATDTSTTSTSITGTAVLTAAGRALSSQRGHAQAVAASGPRGSAGQGTHSSTQPTRPASSPGKHSQPPHATTGGPAPQRRAISPGQDAGPAPARNVGLWQLQDHPELGISAWPDHNTASLGPGAVARQASQAPAKLGGAVEQGGDAARLAKLQRLKQLRSQGPSRPSALGPLLAAASGGGTLGSEESELISLLAQPQLQGPSAPLSTAAGAAAGRAGVHGQQPVRSPGRKEGGGRPGSWGWEEGGSHSRQQHQAALDSPPSATSDEYQTCGDITPSDVTSTDYSSAGHAPGPHPWSHLHHHPLSTQPSDLTSPSSTPASVQPAWARHPTASDTSFTTPMSAESSAYTSAVGPGSRPDQGGPEPGALAAAVAAAVAAQQRQALHRQQGSQGQEQHGSPGQGRLLAAPQAHGCSRQEAGHDAQQRMQHSTARSPPHPRPPAVRQSPPQKVSTAAQTLDTQEPSAAELTGPHPLPEQHGRQGAASQQQQRTGSKQQGRSNGAEVAAHSERLAEAAGTAGVRKGQMAEFVSGEEGSDAVDAAAALLLARSRSLLRQRDPVEKRIQALLARFQPAAPLSRQGEDSNAQPDPAVESAAATKGYRGAGGAAGPHTGQRSLLQEVDQQAGLLPAFPAAAPHPQSATPSQPLSAAQVSAQVREALAADLDLSAVLTKLAARFGMAQPPSLQAHPLPLPSTPSTQITALQAASTAELQGQQGQPTAVPLASMPVRAAGGGRLQGEQAGQPQGGEEVQGVLAAQLGPSSPPARPHAAGSQAGGAGKSASSNSHGYAGQVGVGSSGQGRGSAGSSRQGAGETLPCDHAGEDSVELRPEGSLAASSLQGTASPSAPDAAASPRSPAPAAGGHDLGQVQPSLPASDAQATALDPAGGTTATPPQQHPDAAAGQLLTPPQAPGSDDIASSKPQLLVSCYSPDSPSHTTTCTAAEKQPCPAPGPAPQDPDPGTAFCTPPRAAAYRQLQLLLPSASALPSCWSPTPSSHTSPTSPPSVLHKA